MVGTVIIPARWGSVRLPGKPLLQINGRTVLEHTWRAAMETGLPVWIATDDPRIEAEADRLGARWMPTSECENGTERCAEAARRLALDGPVVNWQGDSPLIPPFWVHELLATLELRGADVATPVQLCTSEQSALLRREFARQTPGGTTVAMNERFDALYFSKAPVPSGGPLWMHVGLYAYTEEALQQYGRQPGALERSERLEQLRFLERGQTVCCMAVEGFPVWEVNNFADLAIVERMMGERDGVVRS